MRKALVVLMVLVMVGGVVAGFLVYLLPALRDKSKDPFADVPPPSIRSYRFADIAGEDLATVDLSEVTASEAETFTFDSNTKWPTPDKMPKDFSPDGIMKRGQYLGLGLKGLHDRGITGKGVSVAILDKPMLKDHAGFPSNLEYVETKPGDPSMTETSFHGAVVAGILAGKNGVAPGAHLYYFAAPDDSEPYARYAEAMNKLLDVNRGLPEDEKIRVVAVPHGADPLDEITGVVGAKDWSAAIRAAQGAGIIVVYPGMSDLDYTGAGAPPSKDRDDPESYQTWTWTGAKAGVLKSINDAGAKTWDAAKKELVRLLKEDPDLDSLRAEAINTYIYLMESYRETMSFDEWLKAAAGDLSKSLALPVDFITVPSVQGKDSFTYYGSGGLSWATPYVAGVIALGLQVKPAASAADLFKALFDTGTPFVTGGKLVDPAAFVQALK